FRQVLGLGRDRVPLPAEQVGPDRGRRAGRDAGVAPDPVACVVAAAGGRDLQREGARLQLGPVVHVPQQGVLRHVRADAAARRRVRVAGGRAVVPPGGGRVLGMVVGGAGFLVEAEGVVGGAEFAVGTPVVGAVFAAAGGAGALDRLVTDEGAATVLVADLP